MRGIFFVILTVISLALTMVGVAHGLEALGVLSLLGIHINRLIAFLLGGTYLGGLVSWAMAKEIASWAMKVQPYSDADAKAKAGDLRVSVERLAKKMDLRALPQLGVYESPKINAFSAGWIRSKTLLGVSQGLLDSLSPAQVEVVLAHELAKIQSGDASAIALMQGFVNVFTLFPARMLSFLAGTSLRTAEEDTPTNNVEKIFCAFLELMLTPLTSLLTRYYARSTEVRADKRAATLVGQQNVASLFTTLASDKADSSPAQREPFTAPLKFCADFAPKLSFLSFHVALSTRARF